MALAVLQQANQILRKPEIIDEKFPKQAAFIRSPAKRKAALCTRRAGKSYGIGLYLYREALKTPNCTCLYLALTRDSARNIMWKDVLKDINRRFTLGAKPNETLLTMTLPNGSEIKLAGADATKEEMEKYLGGKYALIVIDEAGSFKQDMQKLVYENLEPAVADYDGTIVMIGTPTGLTKSLFYDVTKPDEDKREPGWEVHHWTTFDNPYMVEKWDERMRRLISTKPDIVNTPGYKRMYLGQWVLDLNDLCYKFDPYKNTAPKLPEGSYTYVLGVDLGFSPDPSAFVIAAYAQHDKNLYFVEAYKRTEMIISDVAERIRYYQNKYDLHAIVIDNAAKQAVEELKQRYALPLIAADKIGKAEFIEIMNSELIQGMVKVLPAAAELADEWEALIWDDKAAKRVEHPACDNHLCFVAGTLIQTPKGLKTIESLKVGDYVETRKGPRRVSHTINSTAKVVTLSLSNGTQITCTEDHPFWSNGEWIPAAKLNSTHALLSWNEARRAKKLSLTAKLLDAIKTIDILGVLESTSCQNASYFIDKFGNTITAIYRKVITFTTKTVMLTTIVLKTLSYYLLPITSESTRKSEAQERGQEKTLIFLRRLDHSPQSGIVQKPAENGTQNTGKQPLSTWLLHALGAVKNTKSLIWQKTRSAAALTHVFQQKDAPQVSTTFLGRVLTAINNSLQINTQSKTHAPLCVLSISDTTVQEVFNLTVEDEHEYFANGVLVSNCDGSLYAWRFCYQHLATARPGKLSDEEKVESWLEREYEERESLSYKPFWERDFS